MILPPPTPVLPHKSSIHLALTRWNIYFNFVVYILQYSLKWKQKFCKNSEIKVCENLMSLEFEFVNLLNHQITAITRRGSSSLTSHNLIHLPYHSDGQIKLIILHICDKRYKKMVQFIILLKCSFQLFHITLFMYLSFIFSILMSPFPSWFWASCYTSWIVTSPRLGYYFHLS
jgi:hypothetical protein